MKILHVAETIKGGVATVLRQLAIEQSQDAQVEKIVCIVPDTQVKELMPLADDCIDIFRRSGRNIKSFFSLTLKLITNVYTLKPDVVHLHSTFAGVIGRIVIFLMYPLRRPKVIYCPHAFSFLMQGRSRYNNYFSKVERLLLPFTDAVICVSQFEKDKAVEYGFTPEKLHVVYNGVPEAEPLSKNMSNPYPEGKFNLLFVGRFDFQKGFDIFEKIMPILADNNCHLTAVGGAVHDSNFIPEKLPATTFTGWLSSDELKPYFEYADVLIIPSRWEGFAMVPLEAMSYGVPVIASNCTSFPEMVVDGETGRMFTFGHPEQVIQFLESTSDHDWKLMGENGRALFLSKFTATQMISKTKELYSTLL
ncbi:MULTISPECIES: glycosyltransferase [Serratia]|jgi:glycosyltransferase involved in cell wall biosynthesis|uniref:Glycosyltransferase family 1 protein n=1 Tax=Serratia liquefaciens TaxID=614 RepID=A0A515CY12_SERLI|nr:glycosyltransferase [Serratia liquefaciens]MBV0841059.1 glycosyltransferase [Serratia liquefaciens]QDL33022.1 glycosyltransferase family 1 protein [Serratia liquefaciens]HCT9095973.1 glycosyltransferase [Serratia liquefaciens]HED2337219.1 glycosyltransferase [Serratia liquefaciens]